MKTLKFIKENGLYRLLLIPLGVALSLIAKFFPQQTEHFFSQGIYPVIANVVGGLASALPFSIGEVLLILLCFLVPVFIAWGIILLCRHKLTGKIVARFFCKVFVSVSVLFFVFVCFCGLNYYRLEFAELSELEVRPSSVEELAALCDDLITAAVGQRAVISENSDGVSELSHTIADVGFEAKKTVNSLNEKYDFMFRALIKPKPVLTSRVMSYMNITGIFSPFTVEANINIDVLGYTIPATMCHELAHTRGFMREDEANFIAYLACRKSEDLDFNYSGTMLALVYSMNRLYAADSERAGELAKGYSEGMIKDLNANSEYWKQFEGVVAEVSSKVNDSYLKANSQETGVSSYGAMVDLLLADFRLK